MPRISPLIQNYLVANVNKSKLFTILADETTDVSNKEQMALCVRYANLNAKKKIRKDFLQFIEIQDMSR